MATPFRIILGMAILAGYCGLAYVGFVWLMAQVAFAGDKVVPQMQAWGLVTGTVTAAFVFVPFGLAVLPRTWPAAIAFATPLGVAVIPLLVPAAMLWLPLAVVLVIGAALLIGQLVDSAVRGEGAKRMG